MADTTTFYPLLHAMLRANSDPAELDRSRDVMQWVEARTVAIGEVLHHDERMLVDLAFGHWRDFKAATSRSTLEELVRKQEHFQGAITVLEGYDQYVAAGQLQPIDAIDVGVRFRDRIQDWSKRAFIDLMKQAKSIAESGIDIDKKTLKGVEDARNHVLLQLHSQVFGDKAQVRGGSMEVLADRIVPIYEENEEKRKAGDLTIPTGIAMIDDLTGGLDRKTLNLILGTTGQRKSAVARTIAYNAAIQGFRVLFLPLEFPLEEEIEIFAMMHSKHPEFYGTEDMTITNFHNGNLSGPEKTFLKEVLVPHFKEALGKNLVILEVQDKTWPGMQSVIDTEDAKGDLDLVVADYITLLDVTEARDTTFAMHQNVKQIKHKCLHHDNNRGLTFVSPVQGNRKGYAEALANDGLWEPTAIHQYSEMEKSADVIMSTFMPPELAAQNKLKLGFPKTRRRGPIPPQEVNIDPGGGIVGGVPKGPKKETVGPPKKDHELYQSAQP